MYPLIPLSKQKAIRIVMALKRKKRSFKRTEIFFALVDVPITSLNSGAE